MKDFARLDVQTATDFIAGCRKTLVLCHTNPDGDTLGSAGALKRIIELLGGECDAAVPCDVPESLSFLAEGMIRDPDPDAYREIVAVDVASPNQLAGFSKMKDKIDLMIDHHSSGQPFADNLIKTDAAAAGSMTLDNVYFLTGEEARADD